MSAVVTREHRLSVARAWEGTRIEQDVVNAWAGGRVSGYVGFSNLVARLERLAQLVADAEASRPPQLSEYIRQNATAIDEFAGSGPKLLGLVVYLLQLAEADVEPAAPKPPEAK